MVISNQSIVTCSRFFLPCVYRLFSAESVQYLFLLFLILCVCFRGKPAMTKSLVPVFLLKVYFSGGFLILCVCFHGKPAMAKSLVLVFLLKVYFSGVFLFLCVYFRGKPA